MRLEKLVEQHCVHRLVTHSVKLALGIAGYQIRINFLHFLGYEPKLRRSFRVNLFFITEGDWSQCEDYFAGIVHWFDRIFETRRRSHPHAKMTIRVYGNG